MLSAGRGFGRVTPVMTVSTLAGAAILSLVVWLALLFLRGGFWRADQRLEAGEPQRPSWPGVVAVIAARNEAATIGKAVASLLGQDYRGPFSVIVVDDNSTDGTAGAARGAGDDRLSVIAGAPLEPGWTGKLWAVHQGLAAADGDAPDAAYVLLTDADIAHDRGAVRRLVAKAEAENLDLVSLMVRLRCETAWERLLIPAFVFFFQKLYPFAWVNDARRRQAAAAGGCMLVRREALARAGGVRPIRDRIIDDCALAARIKQGGAIWLGLAERSRSLRAYGRLRDVWGMVARTAFTQLEYSIPALAGTVAGMVLIYLTPAVAALAGAMTGDQTEFYAGLAAWLLMGIAYEPTLRLYAQPPWLVLVLPLAALMFILMTIDSARRHWQGAGGVWKGRSYGRPDG